MVKGLLSRGGLQGGVEGCIEGPLHRCKKVVLDVCKSLERDGHQGERAELVHDDLMGLFKNAVGLGIGRAGNARCDAIGLE